MGINLNNPVEFARVTMSPLAGLLQELTGLDPTKWDIVECNFVSNRTLEQNPAALGVYFNVFESQQVYSAGMPSISDYGGRRKVKLEFAYRDGQSTDDLGRIGETYDLVCLFYGNSYKQALKIFLKECNQPSPGILTHPVRGNQVVGLDTYEIVHQSESNKAALVRVRFIEHNFSVGDLNANSPIGDNTVKSALVAALSGVKLIDKVLTKVESYFIAARTISNQLTAALTGYKGGYYRNLQRINITYNSGTSSDLPTLLPVNSGGVANSDGSLASDTFPVVKTPTDPFTGFPSADQQIQPVATIEALNQVNALREEVQAIIVALEATPEGVFEFYQEILDLKETAVLMQQAFEAGIASSQSQIVEYQVPRLMSIREVAFAVGLSVDNSFQIELLNPEIESCNYIPKGTVLQVPTAAFFR